MRSSLFDRPQSYGPVSRLLHGVGALATVLLLGFGVAAWWAGEGPFHRSAAATHMALGGLFVLPLAARIGWRATWLATGQGPQPVAPPGWQRLAERSVHVGLLLMLAALVISGPLLRWLGGNPIDVFGWFQVPSPLEADKTLRGYVRAIHHRAWPVLSVLLVLHLAAAAWHGRSSWVRMLRPGR